jgi:hypothetical protein
MDVRESRERETERGGETFMITRALWALNFVEI